MKITDLMKPVVKSDSDIRKNCLGMCPDFNLIDGLRQVRTAHSDLMKGAKCPYPAVYAMTFEAEMGVMEFNYYPMTPDIVGPDILPKMSLMLGNHLRVIPRGENVASLTVVTVGNFPMSGQTVEALRFISQTFDQRSAITLLPVIRDKNGCIEGYGTPVESFTRGTTCLKISQFLLEVWAVYVGDLPDPVNFTKDIRPLFEGRIDFPIADGDRYVDEEYALPIGRQRFEEAGSGNVERKEFTFTNPAPGLCQICAADHPPDYPHDLGSLLYQFKFNQKIGRSATWADAIAHCPAHFKSGLIPMIKSRGAWVEPEGGPIRHLGEGDPCSSDTEGGSDKYSRVAEGISRRVQMGTTEIKALFELCEEKGLPTKKNYVLAVILTARESGRSPFEIIKYLVDRSREGTGHDSAVERD